MNGSHITIIAEAGVNHNGSLERALEMVRVAARAGADYVKFQTGKASRIISCHAPMADYQVNNTGRRESQLEMVDRIMLRDNDFHLIADECHRQGINFLSTPFDLESIDLLDEIGIDFWKIPSGEITNLPYLRKIASTGRRVVMSTGMAELGEVDAAVAALIQAGLTKEKIILLHCNTEYPTPYCDVNLRAMADLHTHTGLSVGFSDHTLGIEMAIAAAALGAPVIEKHFTLSRNLSGPDHKASLEPHELETMISAIRNVEKGLGDGNKRVTESERKNVKVARKSIVAARFIAKGEQLTETNLTTKRPATGISPMLWDSIVGSVATRDFQPDEPIEL